MLFHPKHSPFPTISTPLLFIAMGFIILCEWTALLWRDLLLKKYLLTILLVSRSVETITLAALMKYKYLIKMNLVIFIRRVSMVIYGQVLNRENRRITPDSQSASFSTHHNASTEPTHTSFFNCDFQSGFLWGLYYSALFGFFVILAGLGVFWLTGKNPLLAIRFTLPEAQSTRILFLLVGGLISPVAEELFFRAYLYTYLRKYGVITALMISTATFALCHYKGNELPLIQMVGGVLFGLVYEKSRHVITPITVHVLGNMSIFTLNLLSLH